MTANNYKYRVLDECTDNIIEPTCNDQFGTYTDGCCRDNLHKAVSSILVAMAVINE